LSISYDNVRNHSLSCCDLV